MGYNSRYVVGIWMGNLDQTPMDGVTGSTGPALLLRSIFAALGNAGITKPLWLSPHLVQKQLCETAKETADCYSHTEYFLPGSENSFRPKAATGSQLKILRPSKGLQIAYDPRVPASFQAFTFVAKKTDPASHLIWTLDNKDLGQTFEESFLWPLQRGQHQLAVEERKATVKTGLRAEVRFTVK